MSIQNIIILLVLLTAICYVIIKITENLKKEKNQVDFTTDKDVVIKPIKEGLNPQGRLVRSPVYEQLDDSYKHVYNVDKVLKDPMFNEVEPKPQEADYEGKPGIGKTSSTRLTFLDNPYPEANIAIVSETKEKNTAISGIMSSIKERAEIIEASNSNVSETDKELEEKISQLSEEEREMLQQIIDKHKK